MKTMFIPPVHSFGEQFLVVLVITGPINNVFSSEVYFCIYFSVRGATNLQFGQKVDRCVIQLLSLFRSRIFTGRPDTRRNVASPYAFRG